MNKETMNANRRNKRKRVGDTRKRNTATIGDKFFMLFIGQVGCDRKFRNTGETNKFKINL